MLRFKIIHPRHRDTELLQVPGMKIVWSPEGVAKRWVTHFQSSKGKGIFKGGLSSPSNSGDMVCISSSSSALMKHHGQGNVQKEEFIWDLQFPRDKYPSLSWWQIEVTLEQSLRVHVLIHWEEAKNTLELSPLNLKACSHRHIFPKMTMPPYFPRNSSIKYSNIWTYVGSYRWSHHMLVQVSDSVNRSLETVAMARDIFFVDLQPLWLSAALNFQMFLDEWLTYVVLYSLLPVQ